MNAPTLAELQAVSLAAWKGALGLGGGEEAFQAALDAGLIWEEPDADGPWKWGLKPKGVRYLAALQRVVDGLSEPMIAMARVFASGLDGHRGRGSNVTIDALLKRGLLTGRAWPGYSAVPLTHAALLLLRERGKDGAR